MASELRVTTIANNAGSESVGTTYVVNGSAKQWTNFNQTNHSTRDSHNQSSLTDDGAGLSTINFANSMNNANYCVHNTKGNEGNRGFHSVRSTATGNYKIDSRQETGSETDASIQMCNVHGDLA